MTDPTGIDPGDLIFLGRVEKPHGLKGALSVRLYSGHGHAGIPAGTSLHLEGLGPVEVTRCTERGDSRFSLTFAGIRSREEAEQYRNASLSITRAEASSKLEFVPLFAFAGLTLRSRGEDMKVLDVEPSGQNPMLLVENGEKRFHVPINMVMDLGSVDWDGMLAEVDLPEGIQDLPI